MKLSDLTLSILKNFSTINKGIVIREGKQLRTISVNKAVLAEATVAEEFPRELGIYDLTKFLNALSLHENPELTFQEQYIALGAQGGRARTRLRYTETKLINQPPNKSLNVPSFDVEFALSQDDLAWINKIGSILGCPNVVVSNEDGKITVSAADVKGEVVDDSSLTVGDCADPTPFKFAIKVDNLLLIPGSYKVQLTSQGIAKFTNQNIPLHYFVAVEKSHTFYGKAA
jgi:hypothetical protein